MLKREYIAHRVETVNTSIPIEELRSDLATMEKMGATHIYFDDQDIAPFFLREETEDERIEREHREIINAESQIRSAEKTISFLKQKYNL